MLSWWDEWPLVTENEDAGHEDDTPHLRESGLRNPGNVCLWNPGIHQMLTCGIQNPRFWNAEYSSKNPVSSTGNPESTAWNPRFPYMARLLMPPIPQWNVKYKIRRAVDTFVFRVYLGPFINHIIRSPWPSHFHTLTCQPTTLETTAVQSLNCSPKRHAELLLVLTTVQRRVAAFPTMPQGFFFCFPVARVPGQYTCDTARVEEFKNVTRVGCVTICG